MAELDFDEQVQGVAFTDFRGNSVTVTKVKRAGALYAYTYESFLNVDWDGAHKAYGLDRPAEEEVSFPDQQGLTPYERGPRLFSSGRHAQLNYWVGIYAVSAEAAKQILRLNYPNWNRLKRDEQDRIYQQFHDTRTDTPYGSLEDLPRNGKFPIVQLRQLNQPYPGYYVSQATAVVSREAYSARPWDQTVYIDAAAVPYVVVPRLEGANKGGYGLVIRKKTGAFTPFIFGDAANRLGSTRLGESSGYIYTTIAEGRYNEEPYIFLVFPNTGNGKADRAAVAKSEATVREQLLQLTNPTNQAARELVLRLAMGQDYAAVVKKQAELYPEQVAAFERIGQAMAKLGVNVTAAKEAAAGDRK